MRLPYSLITSIITALSVRTGVDYTIHVIHRYVMRYTRTQHRPASRQVNNHGRISGTHRQTDTEHPHPFSLQHASR